MRIVLFLVLSLISACSQAGKPTKPADPFADGCENETWEQRVEDSRGYSGYVGHCDPKTHRTVVDVEATEAMLKLEREEMQHRHKLAWALRTRVLTAKEMGEVESYGKDLLVDTGVPYKDEDLERRFDALLAQQAILRTMHDSKPCSANDAAGEPK